MATLFIRFASPSSGRQTRNDEVFCSLKWSHRVRVLRIGRGQDDAFVAMLHAERDASLRSE